jgi:hypothetical protein
MNAVAKNIYGDIIFGLIYSPPAKEVSHGLHGFTRIILLRKKLCFQKIVLILEFV